MKSRLINLLIVILVLSAAYYGYLGRYYTYYGLGVFLVPLVFIIGSFILLGLFAINRFGMKKPNKRSWRIGFTTALLICNTLFIALIADHYISNYKPTRTFYIPDDYIGCIYLFETTAELHSDTISENGIGYIHWDPDYYWRLERNGVDVTEAWNVGNPRGTIMFYHEDSTVLEVIEVGCALINDSNHYKEFSVYSTIIPTAMHPSTYTEMVNWGLIDDSKVLRAEQMRINKLSKWSIVLEKYVGQKYRY